MNAVELLKSDHEVATDMLKRLESEEEVGGTRRGLFDDLKAALQLHTKLEEQFFYPALENFDETRDLVREAYEEHRQVDELLAEMSGAWEGRPGVDTPDRSVSEITSGEGWESRLGELKESIKHHVGEEEGELFPLAERLLGRSRLEEMGRLMEQMKVAEEPYNYDTFRRHMMKEDMRFRGGPEPGQLAPDFDLPTTDGGRFRLSDYRGKQPVLIEFGSVT